MNRLLTLVLAACAVGLTPPAHATEILHISNESIVDWILNGFFLSLFVMIVLVHKTIRILSEGVKPEVRSKYGRYSGAMAMLFDGLLQDKYIQKRDQMKIYFRITALTSVFFFLSLFLFKS